jgi:fucose permease
VTDNNTPPGTADYRLLHAAAFASIFCLGLSAAAIGPVLPFLADDVGVSLDTAGLLLTAFFVGSIATSALVALALHGHDTRLLCLFGLCFQALGTSMLAIAPSFEIVLVAGVVIGIGDGLVVAATHILMPATSDDVPAALNWLNIYFSIGAIVGPIWTGAILATTGDRLIVYGGIVATLLVAIAITIVADVAVHRPIAAPDEEFRFPGNPTAWIMGGVLFLYVGAEFGLGAWVSTFAQETVDVGVFGAAMIAAGYWAALAAGRIGTAWYFSGQREPARLLAAACLGATIAATVLALSSGNVAVATFSALGAGFFLGPIWPAVTAIAAESANSSAMATTVTMGNAGGVAIPWAQGKVLVGAGAAQGVAVTAVLCGIMFGIVTVFRAKRGDRVGSNARIEI